MYSMQALIGTIYIKLSRTVYVGKVGVGEREARIYSRMVAERHFR